MINSIIHEDYLANESNKLTQKYLKIYRHLQNPKGILSSVYWKILNKRILSKINIEISKNAQIGKGLRMPHLNGIVISKYAKIGEHCTIYHQVTIGANEHKADYKNSPTIGNHVYIGAGAKLIGPINIGDNVIVGANAVVTKDVPEGKTVIGINQIIETHAERDPYTNK